MAKLPGLTRQDDRPSAGGSNRGRAQVRNPIGDVSLQPQARPVDTYSRPMAREQGPNGLQQLAGALAQINPSLQTFLASNAERMQKDEEDRALKRIGGMSFEEARAAVDGGKMTELDNPWFKAAFMKQYGERMAYHRVNELTQEYETSFDKANGDLDSFIRERTAEDLERYGNSPHFTSSYGRILDQFGAKANSAQAQYVTEQTKQQTIGGVYDTFSGQARQLLADGKSPEEVVQTLRGKYDANRQLLHVDYREQDREMVRLAESFASEGNLTMAKAILSSERKGSDGTVLGPLAQNREFQADANRILNVAERNLFENNEKATRDQRLDWWDKARQGQLKREDLLSWHQANPGAYSEAQVQSLINQNDSFNEQQAALAAKNQQKLALAASARKSEQDVLTKNMDSLRSGMLPYIEEATVLTDTGETKKVSVEDQKKALAKEVVDQTDWLVDQKRAAPEQAFAMQVESFSTGNLTNPKWEHVLQAGPKAATQFNLAGGQKPPGLDDSVDLYMRLHASNPKLLETHIKDASDRDFYEAYRVATQYGQMGHDQALQNAMMQTSDPSKFQGSGTQQRFDQIDQRVKDISFGGFMGIGASSPYNQGYVSNEIGRLGKFYAQNGMGTEDALDEAKKRFEATHTEINGNYVYTAGKDIPANFSTLAKNAIDNYVKDFGEKEGVEASDLTIRPATNGQGWLIVHNTGQFPVENAGRANLTLRSLFEMEEQRKASVKDKIIEQQNKR